MQRCDAYAEKQAVGEVYEAGEEDADVLEGEEGDGDGGGEEGEAGDLEGEHEDGADGEDVVEGYGEAAEGGEGMCVVGLDVGKTLAASAPGEEE